HRRHGGQRLQLRLIVQRHWHRQPITLAGQTEQVKPQLLERCHVLAHCRTADTELLTELLAGVKLAIAEQGDQCLPDGSKRHASTSSSQVSPVRPMKRT